MPQASRKKILILPLLLLLGWLCLRYLLPIAMPFLLAVLLALAAEPLVAMLQRRVRLPRSAAAGAGITAALAVLVLVMTVLGALLLRQLQSLMDIVPDLEDSAASGLQALRQWLLSLAENTPNGLRAYLTGLVESSFSDGTLLLDSLAERLLGLASGLVSQLPDSALGIGTWLLASFMLSAKLPAIRAGLRQRLPQSWHSTYLPMLRQLKQSVLGWLTAQLKLMSVTFAVLAVGFALLRVSHGLLWALVVSLVDALPILGTGTVLVPWSVVCFIQGDTPRAIGLLGIYAAAALLRSVLEPKLVGKQLGLDPLVTLAVMYTGYRLWGILGMILSPLLAVTLMQLFSPPKTA